MKKWILKPAIFFCCCCLFFAGCDRTPIRPAQGKIQLPKTGAHDTGAGVAWPDPRFVDGGNGIRIDKLTGLMWFFELPDDALEHKKTWQQALDYVRDLEAGGHTDWRLPNSNELRSLIDFTKKGTCLPTGLPSGWKQNFWSSTTMIPEYGFAYRSSMSDGRTYFGYKSELYYAVAVRPAETKGAIELAQTGQTSCYDAAGIHIDCAGTGQDGDTRAGIAWPDPRFQNNNDGTITDMLTGLIWIAASPKTGTWLQAKKHVSELNKNKYLEANDWRLPTMHELASLFNAEEFCWIDRQGFTSYCGIELLWSSTGSSDSPFKVRTFDLSSGTIYAGFKIPINSKSAYKNEYLWEAFLPVR